MKSPLHEMVRTSLHHYFSKLEGEEAAGIYHLVIAAVEAPLLEVVMKEAGDNQCRAAKWLGLSRGTLRKLLKKYALL